MNKHGQTICLTMIVKDESSVILRSLESVKNIVDYYCICDTGSTDNTVEVVTDYLKSNNLSGEVLHHDWVDFGHNRTLALKACEDKCDYQLTLDADEVFYKVVDGKITDEYPDTIEEFLHADICNIKCYFGGTVYDRNQLWKSNAGICWQGVCHEHIATNPPRQASFQSVPSIGNVPSTEGARSKNPNKYLDDAKLFEKDLKNNPQNARSWFYLAQSYADGGKPKKAIEPLKQAYKYSKWDEEKFMSLHRLGEYYAAVDKEMSANAFYYFMQAYQERPHRVEPLYSIIRNCRETGKFKIGEPLCDAALKIKYPSSDALFINSYCYGWSLLDEVSIIYYWVGRFEESYNLCLQLLDRDDTPESEKARIRANADFAKNNIV